MLRFFFSLLILTHGLVHLIGFAKAFTLLEISQLQKSISQLEGLLWLIAALLFLIVSALILMQKNAWVYAGIIAILLSQALIVLSWQDAKYGTVANIVFLLALIFAYGENHFEDQFRKDVRLHTSRTDQIRSDILKAGDIKHLPPIVQKYLDHSKVLDHPKVKNFKVVMEGQMRNRGREYFPFKSVQYNFVENPSRLFFMKGKMFGITIPGYHKYENGKASMNIKLFGLIPLIKEEGPVLDKTETVTLFNDMCLMAPATLIDEKITWKIINDTTVLALFTNAGICIKAKLYFTEEGKLVNFISHDRTDIGDMQPYPFHTPVHSYSNFNQFYLTSRGDAEWIYPEGVFTYGKFHLRSINYNVGG